MVVVGEVVVVGAGAEVVLQGIRTKPLLAMGKGLFEGFHWKQVSLASSRLS